MDYSSGPHLISALFEHLNYLLCLNAQIQILYDLIQKSRNDLEICPSFLAEVFTFIRNREHFQWHFGIFEKDFI